MSAKTSTLVIKALTIAFLGGISQNAMAADATPAPSASKAPEANPLTNWEKIQKKAKDAREAKLKKNEADSANKGAPEEPHAAKPSIKDRWLKREHATTAGEERIHAHRKAQQEELEALKKRKLSTEGQTLGDVKKHSVNPMEQELADLKKKELVHGGPEKEMTPTPAPSKDVRQHHTVETNKVPTEMVKPEAPTVHHAEERVVAQHPARVPERAQEEVKPGAHKEPKIETHFVEKMKMEPVTEVPAAPTPPPAPAFVPPAPGHKLTADQQRVLEEKKKQFKQTPMTDANAALKEGEKELKGATMENKAPAAPGGLAEQLAKKQAEIAARKAPEPGAAARVDHD